ncbi:MAG TPA: alpha-ketoglutarate-dependent dioxygenase AlkB [Polyangiaceae bacterium]|nr:alpha-ketoglutarate-dependent dioxygenase AlkB [Polyangiaceae bacterium]
MQRIELHGGAWVETWDGWLRPPEAAALAHTLMAELPWEQRNIVLFGKPVLQPRLIAWAGELPYRYSGQTLEPRPWPSAARGVLTRISATARIPFNHVLINRYRDGKDSMGYHADAEPELGRDPVVATLSLGETRRFVLRRHERASDEPPLVLPLRNGSLLIMGGTCQRHYRHAIPRDAHPALDERISLTFRHILRAPAAAPS